MYLHCRHTSLILPHLGLENEKGLVLSHHLYRLALVEFGSTAHTVCFTGLHRSSYKQGFSNFLKPVEMSVAQKEKKKRRLMGISNISLSLKRLFRRHLSGTMCEREDSQQSQGSAHYPGQCRSTQKAVIFVLLVFFFLVCQFPEFWGCGERKRLVWLFFSFVLFVVSCSL